MKNRYLIIAVIVVVVAITICLFLLYSPRPVIKSPYSMAYDIERTYSAESSGASYKTVDDNYFFVDRILYYREDVTDRFDPEALACLLSKSMSRRTSRKHGSADILWEISIIRRNGPIHICLGQADSNSEKILNYWYQSGPCFQILDPIALMNSLEQLMKNNAKSTKVYLLSGENDFIKIDNGAIILSSGLEKFIGGELSIKGDLLSSVKNYTTEYFFYKDGEKTTFNKNTMLIDGSANGIRIGSDLGSTSSEKMFSADVWDMITNAEALYFSLNGTFVNGENFDYSFIVNVKNIFQDTAEK